MICGGWVDGHFDIFFDILLKPPQPFTGLFFVIETPTKQQFAQYRQLVTQFLWDNKKPQIAYKKLIRDYTQAGLKLVDLEKKTTAMKVKWIQVARFRPETTWAKFLVYNLPTDIEYFIRSNLGKKDITDLTIPKIIRDTLSAWSEINYFDPTAPQDILEQNLWFNSHIKTGSKVIFLKSWYHLGINKVEQLIDKQTKELKSCEQMWHEFGRMINFIDIYKMHKAIPKEWITTIKKTLQIESIQTAAQLISNNIKCSNIVYHSLIDRLLDDGRNKYKWECDLDCEITEKCWQTLHARTKKLTLSTKLIFFQFQISHRYLTTNVKISQWDKTVDKRCSFCLEQEETLMHLFVQCKYVKNIWCALSK